jgi:hypothetical protein
MGSSSLAWRERDNWLGAEHLVNAHPKGLRQLWQHPTAWRSEFQKANVGRVNADSLGQFDLRQAGSLAQFRQAQAQGGRSFLRILRISALAAAFDASRNQYVFDHISDALLLAPRQAGGPFKELPHFAGRSRWAAFGGFAADQEVGADIVEGSKKSKLFGANGGGFALPKRVGPARDTQSVGYLRLAQPRLFAQSVQPLAEGRAGAIGGSSGFHLLIIPGRLGCQKKCLHV